MKALHIVTAFPRHDQDIITPWLGQVLLGLRAAGVDARVFAPSYRGGGATEWRGIPVERFRYAPAPLETLTHDETAPDRLRRRPWYGGLLPGYVLGGMWAAARAGRSRPDIIHVHWPVPHALFGAVARAASHGSSALVSSYYSVEIRWIERRMRGLVPFLRWTVESADAVTAISSATARAVAAYTDDPIRVIPFASGLDVVESALTGSSAGPDEEGAGPDVGNDEGARRPAEILFVGRLVERKGVEVLVSAMARLQEHASAHLTIVGEGAWKGRIREAIVAAGIEDRVRLAGRLDERDLVRAYRTADLFVLPAVVDAKGDTEGLGVVLIEALRAGVPVVASDIGGIPDIVVDGETGWLVPPGDADRLAAVIDRALSDPAEGRRRVECGRERVERDFSLEGVVSSLIECYGAATDRRRRSG